MNFSQRKNILISILVGSVVLYLLIFSPPVDFPLEAKINIQQGMNLRGISLELKEQKIIRSRVAFEAFVILYGGEKSLQSSDYLFDKKIPVYEVARRIAKGERNTPPIVVTIPEGFDVDQISNAFKEKLVNFDENKFALQAESKEGYLFPDTYYFFSGDDEAIVLTSLTTNFNKKIKPLLPLITASGKTQDEIIIMASIIEREAKGDTDRGVISGILWRRLDIGMPLQVDAALETYKTKGLPESPISNPGIESIKAAIQPQDTQYLYYLHDKEGGIHYARTFSEHVQNKRKYLLR